MSLSPSSFIDRRPAPPVDAPAPKYSQTELRDRRQKYLPVLYGSGFDLATEIGDMLSPLGAQVSALPSPLVLREQIEDTADAVHEIVSTAVGLLAESRLDADAHARTRERVRDLAQRPRAPEISDDEIIEGTWATALVAYVTPLSTDFATYLGRELKRPVRPDRPDLAPAANERLLAALRVLDEAVGKLTEIIPRAAARAAVRTPEQINEATKARQARERVERALARIGARA